MPDMPMPLPMPGAGPQLPPGLAPQPANLGGLSAPQGNPGNAAAGMLKVRQAIKMLEDALPMIPMGSPLHDKMLSSLKGMLDAMPDEDPSMAGPQQTNLLELLKSSQANAPMAMLARLGAAGGPAGAPMPPGAAPSPAVAA